MNGNHFGRWLQRQLDSHEWNQSDLAARIGVTASMVSRWVRGERVPDPASCDLIADGLMLDLRYVMIQAGHLPDEDRPTHPLREDLVAMARRVPEPRLDLAVRVLRELMVPSRD